MTDNKTTATTQDIAEFLTRLDDPVQRRDSETFIAIMQQISGEPPVLWGPSIIGFGTMHYVYASGREGDMPKIAFSPRKGRLTVYVTTDASQYITELDAMGKYKIGKGCIYINKLADVDRVKLTELIKIAYEHSEKIS